jgi:phosphoglycolate phosphatase
MKMIFTGIRAAIVDLDGTMVDTARDFEAALDAALADLALPPAGIDFVRRTIGKGGENLVRQALRQAGVPADEAERLFGQGFERYQHHYGLVNGRHAVVYAGVAEGLAALRARGLVLACVTNKPTRFARDLLQHVGLAAHFAGPVHGADAFARKKPDPLPLIETCSQLGVRPAHTLVIGDSRNDAEAARAAGCPVVLVRGGYNHGEPLENAGADVLVSRLDEVPRLLP